MSTNQRKSECESGPRSHALFDDRIERVEVCAYCAQFRNWIGALRVLRDDFLIYSDDFVHGGGHIRLASDEIAHLRSIDCFIILNPRRDVFDRWLIGQGAES